MAKPHGWAVVTRLGQHLGGSGLSRLVFSGCTLAEIRRLSLGAAILARVDVLVAGRYVASQRTGRGLLGSANQRLHLLTDRYRLADLFTVPACEVVLHADGSYTVSGVAPLEVGRPGRS
ncbi:radical SAM protein [Candidatus Binatia bacterium]|nr:radical SAM protein [Candidatus Binatia bacterium]